MTAHALCRALRFASTCIGFGLPFALISGSAPLLLHLSWYILCLQFGFCIPLRHLRWYLCRLQFGFFLGILMRRWFSYPVLPSFRFLIPSVLILVPPSTVAPGLVPLPVLVSVYDPTREV